MDRERLDRWCERGVLGLVLSILIYTPLATGAVRPQDFVVVEWLTVALLFVWGARFWLNPKHRLLWPPVCWAVLLFVGYALFRYLKADIEFVARQEMIKVLIYGFIFFAILNNLHRLESTQIVGMTLVFLGMAISIYALLQFLTESEHVWHFIRPDQYRNRGSGTFISPNNLAGYLEMLLPLALAYTLTGRLQHVHKVLVGYASLSIFTGIVVTVSRGGWVATGASLFVLFFWLMRQRDFRLQSLLLLGALIAIAAVFILKAELSQNRKESLAKVPVPEDLRFKFWRSAIEIWRENFWIGGGPAHFDYRFRQHRPADSFPDQVQVRPDRVHNDYLNTLADWGLIGAILVASAWLIFYWELFRSWKFVQRAQNDLSNKCSNKSAFVMGGALGLLAILVHSIVDFNMHIPANAILAVTIMALVTGHFRFASEQHWQTVHPWLRIVITGVFLSALLYLGKQSWQRTVECHWIDEAEAQPSFSQNQIDALRKAFAAEPRNFETAYKIGECLRMQSWQGEDGYQELAKRALAWFKRGMALNAYDPYCFMRYGMCLDWLGQHAEAEPFFHQAAALDPHGYYVLAHVGWHYVQKEDWATAKQWFERSQQMNWANNPIAKSYLDLIAQRLSENPNAR